MRSRTLLRCSTNPRLVASTRHAKPSAGIIGTRVLIDPDHIHLTAGTSEAYSFLFKLLVNEGESVMIPRPGYPLFEFLAAMDGVQLRPYDLAYTHPTGWQIDFDSLEAKISESTRAILIISPNNPTGSFLKRTELARLTIFARGTASHWWWMRSLGITRLKTTPGECPPQSPMIEC